MNSSPVEFFLFGAGNRRKLLYRNNELLDCITRDILYTWDTTTVSIEPAQYRVVLTLATNQTVCIYEDTAGIWLETNGSRNAIVSGPAVNLPDFAGHPYRDILRITHHEILVNILDGKPLPNFMVYQKPWYRDSAMMAMVLQKTGNLDLLRDWVVGLTEVFDRNNGGNEEADNPGQVLYLLSLFTDRHHPLVETVLQKIKAFEMDGYISGSTDFGSHVVYQTAWMKFGLRCLGLPDPYTMPQAEDSYAALFWWDTTLVKPIMERRFFPSDVKYPYLTWAEAHSCGDTVAGELIGTSYPLSWETEASQADYSGMSIVDPAFTERKQCMPHTWHAAELFLYHIDKE